jgi:L-amino acid N-acyltransferase YncA
MAFIVRLAGQGDAEQILAIYAPIVRLTAISFELEPPTIAEMQERIDSTLVHFPWLVCDNGGSVLGYAYASRHRTRPAYQWSVDTSVYIHPQSRRSGIGRALYTSLFKILCLQGYSNAYAGIALPNPGSVGLHEAMGFKPIGIYQQVGYKLGAWHDVGWWYLQLQLKSANPQPPRSLATVVGLDYWQSALAGGNI